MKDDLSSQKALRLNDTPHGQNYNPSGRRAREGCLTGTTPTTWFRSVPDQRMVQRALNTIQYHSHRDSTLNHTKLVEATPVGGTATPSARACTTTGCSVNVVGLTCTGMDSNHRTQRT
jgi:hypothetical protein